MNALVVGAVGTARKASARPPHPRRAGVRHGVARVVLRQVVLGWVGKRGSPTRSRRGLGSARHAWELSTTARPFRPPPVVMALVGVVVGGERHGMGSVADRQEGAENSGSNGAAGRTPIRTMEQRTYTATWPAVTGLVNRLATATAALRMVGTALGGAPCPPLLLLGMGSRSVILPASLTFLDYFH